MLKLSATQKATKFQAAHVLFSGGTGSKSSFWSDDTSQYDATGLHTLSVHVQTHHKHALGMAETRLVDSDLEPTNELCCTTFSHG